MLHFLHFHYLLKNIQLLSTRTHTCVLSKAFEFKVSKSFQAFKKLKKWKPAQKYFFQSKTNSTFHN